MSEKYEKKIKNLEKTLPMFWNSYEHIFEARQTGIQNNINFLLIIVSFLPAVSLMIFFHYKNFLFLFPIIAQFIALLILLKSFFIKGQKIPWLKLQNTIDNLNKKIFVPDLISNLKAAENDTWTYLKELQKIIRAALISLILSIFLIALAFLFMLMGGSLQLYIGSVILLLLFLLLHFYYEKNPKFKYNEKYKESMSILEKWLND